MTRFWRGVLHKICLFIVLGFIFLVGAGAAKDLWGGVVTLVLVLAVWGLFEFSD